MQVRELSIPDAFEVTPVQHGDDRGLFLEWYRFEALEETLGHALDLKQANLSVSQRGVVRGIHYADIPPSQAKYVTVPHGAVVDFVVDIRFGSPTYGRWDSVLLDDIDRRAVYLAEGLGHAFVALTDRATVSYLTSAVYAPGREHGIHPLDPEVGLRFPREAGAVSLSSKDAAAPSLAEAAASGVLPSWDAARGFYDSLAKD